MVKIYGSSDDLVEIEGSESNATDGEIGCYGCYVRMWMTDGATIQISYGKNGKAIWQICIEKPGAGNSCLVECNDEDAEIYSDIYETDADIKDYDVIAMDTRWNMRGVRKEGKEG